MSKISSDRSVKTVKCPQCAGPSIYCTSNAFRPFCSERCKLMDLGAWASERFALPEQTPAHHPNFEAD